MTRIKNVYITAAGVLASLTGRADATDLGKALARPITASFTSPKSIFDLERCIVLLDGRGLPFVYRQPDRPNDAMIAFTQGIAVLSLITLQRDGVTTKVEARDMTGLMSGVGHKLPSGFEGCL